MLPVRVLVFSVWQRVFPSATSVVRFSRRHSMQLQFIGTHSDGPTSPWRLSVAQQVDDLMGKRIFPGARATLKDPKSAKARDIVYSRARTGGFAPRPGESKHMYYLRICLVDPRRQEPPRRQNPESRSISPKRVGALVWSSARNKGNMAAPTKTRVSRLA